MSKSFLIYLDLLFPVLSAIYFLTISIIVVDNRVEFKTSSYKYIIFYILLSFVTHK